MVLATAIRYVGDQAVTAIYVGSELVWQASPPSAGGPEITDHQISYFSPQDVSSLSISAMDAVVAFVAYASTGADDTSGVVVSMTHGSTNLSSLGRAYSNNTTTGGFVEMFIGPSSGTADVTASITNPVNNGYMILSAIGIAGYSGYSNFIVNYGDEHSSPALDVPALASDLVLGAIVSGSSFPATISGGDVVNELDHDTQSGIGNAVVVAQASPDSDGVTNFSTPSTGDWWASVGAAIQA